MTDLAHAAANDALFRRQTGFFDPNENATAPATFVGVGGIGSFAAFATAKLGVPNLTLIDPDQVEVHNVPNQFSPASRVGEDKVSALAAEITSHMGDAVSVDTHAKLLAEYSDYRDIVVSGLDSMAARHELWEQVKMNPAVQLYIDGRIAGQMMILYALCPYNLDAIEHYEKTLHSDDEAVEANCTERGLIDVGFSIGALISRMIRRHYTQQEIKPVTYMNMDGLELRKGDWVV